MLLIYGHHSVLFDLTRKLLAPLTIHTMELLTQLHAHTHNECPDTRNVIILSRITYIFQTISSVELAMLLTLTMPNNCHL